MNTQNALEEHSSYRLYGGSWPKMFIVIIVESISVLFLFTSSHHYHGHQCFSNVLLKHHQYRSGHVGAAGYDLVGLLPIT